jgi:hypothetical protein
MKTPLQKFSVAVFVLMLLSMLDTCILAWSTPRNKIKAVAGGTKNITGKLVDPVDPNLLKIHFETDETQPAQNAVDEILTYEPRYREFQIRFVQAQGRMWRAVLKTEPNAAAGDYPIRVFQRDRNPGKDTPQVTVQIFSDEHSYRKSFLSLSRRFLGLEPWWITLFLLPVGALCVYLVMRQTAEEEDRLQSIGVGPIYKLAKGKNHWDIMFGLGSKHGIRPGDRLQILNPKHQIKGYLDAIEVGPESSTAILDLHADIAPDDLIARNP